MMHKIICNLFKYVGWTLVIYAIIFQPIINKYIYIGVELLLVAYLFLKKHKLFSENIKLFKKEYVFAGLICTYSFILDLSHFNLVYFDRFVASFFQGYFVAFFLIYCISKSHFLQEYLSRCIILICLLACSITIAAILIPSFGEFCIENATMDVKDRLEEMFVLGNKIQYRSFGLSESLNFTYAYVLSVIGAYLLSTGFRLITPPLLLMIIVSIIFNSRISFIPLIISLFYILFIQKKNIQNLSSLIIIIVLCISLGQLGLSQFPELNSEWGMSFFTEMSSVANGEEDNTVGTLTGSMWIVPDNIIDIVFGTGESIYLAQKNNSDVGYILQLNYGGLVLLIIILSYYFYISKRIVRMLGMRHWFPIIFVSSIFILNFKGFYLAAIPGNRFLTFLYVYYIYSSRKGVKELNPKCHLILT